MNEQYYEKLLNIKTSGEQKIFNKSAHYNRYEPTSYEALALLSNHYAFTADDTIVDFGCGKGRLNFYIHHFFDAKVTGIEMNAFFYEQAIANKKEYLKKHKNNIDKITFSNCLAEEYPIKPSDTTFYFFNPFSTQIFRKVIGNIVASVNSYERTVDLILYYPSYDYLYFLENHTPFVRLHEILLPSGNSDPRNNFSIYRLG